MSPRAARAVEGASVTVISRSAVLAWVLGGGAVGFLLNLAPVVILNGASLIFGGVAVLTVALRFGGPAGALAAAIASYPTLGLWETPVAALVAIAEAFVIGQRRFTSAWGLHRTQLVFWLLLGVPAMLLWYLGIREVSAYTATIIVVKSVLNAALSLSLARVISLAPRFWSANRPGRKKVSRSLRDYLIGAAAIAVAIPTVLSMVVLARIVDRNQRRLEAERVQQLAQAAASTVSGIMNERMAGLVAAARQLGGKAKVDPSLAQQLLDAAGPARASFVTMLVTDSLGDFVAGYAADPAIVAALRRDGFNVADRDYFRVPRETRRVFVSEVFIGRGFGRDRITAMSAPILGPQGEFLGVVEGSMATNLLQEFLGAIPQGYEVLLLSATGQVVVWSHTAPPPATERIEQLWGRVLSAKPVTPADPVVQSVVLERRDEPRLPIAAQTRLVASVPGPYGWTVLSRRSLAEAEAGIQSMIQLTLVGSLLVFLLLWVIFSRVLRDVLEPLAVIEDAVSDTPMDGETAPQSLEPRISPYAPRELVALAEGFDIMSAALSERFAELRRTIAERDRLNAELEGSANALDFLVQQRTRELEAALDEARSASAAKTEFLASMSHELRTPLNAMIGSVDTLREGLQGPLNAKQDRTLAMVDASAQHLLALINDILDTEKLEAGRLQVRRERVDVRALMSRVMATMQPLAEQGGIDLRSVLPTGVLWIDADALRLQQVLVNLVGNAIKFTPESGRITVRVKTGHVPGHVVRIEVEDSGAGIPEDQRTRIFEPFTRLDTGDTRRYGGTGLGLSISRRLCEAMGLRISVGNSSASGTVFVVERAG
jgi:signal transduction histidine kinase